MFASFFGRIVTGLVLASCAMAALAEVVDISVYDLSKLQNQGVAVVDVRTAPEWAQTGVVAGSRLVTLGNDPAFFRAMDQAADPAKPVVLICRSGNRSGVAARMLSERSPGRKIYNVREGMNGWLAARQPVVSPATVAQVGRECGSLRC